MAEVKQFFQYGELRRGSNGLYGTELFNKSAKEINNLRVGVFDGLTKREGSFFLEAVDKELSTLFGWGASNLVYVGDASQANTKITVYYPKTNTIIHLNLMNTAAVLSTGNLPQLFWGNDLFFYLKFDDVWKITPFAQTQSEKIIKVTDLKTEINVHPEADITVGDDRIISTVYALGGYNIIGSNNDGVSTIVYDNVDPNWYINVRFPSKQVQQYVFTGAVFDKNTGSFYNNASVTIQSISDFSVEILGGAISWSYNGGDGKPGARPRIGGGLTYYLEATGGTVRIDGRLNESAVITSSSKVVHFGAPHKAVIFLRRLFLFGQGYIAFSEPDDFGNFNNGTNVIKVDEMTRCTAVIVVYNDIIFATEEKLYFLSAGGTSTFLPILGFLTDAEVIEDGLISRASSVFVVTKRGIFLLLQGRVSLTSLTTLTAFQLVSGNCLHIFDKKMSYASKVVRAESFIIRLQRADTTVFECVFQDDAKIFSASRLNFPFVDVQLSKNFASGVLGASVGEKRDVCWIPQYYHDLDNMFCTPGEMLNYPYYNFLDTAVVWQSSVVGRGILHFVSPTLIDLIFLQELFYTVTAAPMNVIKPEVGKNVYLKYKKIYYKFEIAVIASGTPDRWQLKNDFNFQFSEGDTVEIIGVEHVLSKTDIDAYLLQGKTHGVYYNGNEFTTVDLHYVNDISGAYVAVGRAYEAYVDINYPFSGVSRVMGAAKLQTYGTDQIYLQCITFGHAVETKTTKLNYFDGEKQVHFPNIAMTNASSQVYRIKFELGLFASLQSIRFFSEGQK